MTRLVTVVTGPIVGLDTRRLLQRSVDFATRLGIGIVVYNLFDELLEQQGLSTADTQQRMNAIGELLDGYGYQFDLMRQNAYQSIGRKLAELPQDAHVVVRAPATVIWRGVCREFKDHRTLVEAIRPDRIVTLIDAEWKILKRLQTDYGQHDLKVIAHQEHVGVEWILSWLGSEVSRSEDWAQWATQITGKHVPHNVMGVSVPSRADRSRYVQDVDNVVKLVAAPSLTAFYASYSMTVATEQIRGTINELIWRLRHYGAVIDPASIELAESDDARRPEEQDAVFAYTVTRDLTWDVKKVDIVTALHPYPKMPPLSTGMMDELGHARAFGKERYLLLPSGAGSPFTKGNFVPTDHVFTDGDALFAYLEQTRQPQLRPRFSEQCDAFAQWQDQQQNTSKP